MESPRFTLPFRVLGMECVSATTGVELHAARISIPREFAFRPLPVAKMFRRPLSTCSFNSKCFFTWEVSTMTGT
eukprot:6944722-Pyramimonas_sp.AAC.1